MTKIKKTANAVKSLEDAIRQAIGVFPPTLPLAMRNKSQPQPQHDHGHDKGYRITSPYGMREMHGKENFHRGTDIGMPVNTPVYAVYDGIVGYAGWQDSNNHDKGGGQYVKIKHEDGIDSFYMHLSKIMVSVGDKVKAGQVVGYSGNTGDSTGPHLHFEMRQDGQHRAPNQSEVRYVQHGGPAKREFENA